MTDLNPTNSHLNGRFVRTKSALERFEGMVVPEPMSGCWIWIGNLTGHRYGGFFFEGKQVKAHRWAYEHFVGPVPDGLELDHLCRVKCCVNPAHLEPVTRRENILRGTAPDAVREMQAAKTHCPKGHPYAGHNLLLWNRPNGTVSRQCRICRGEGAAARSREYRARKRREREVLRAEGTL